MTEKDLVSRSTSAPPLRKKTAGGKPYARRSEVQAELLSLSSNTIAEIADQSMILDQDDENYLSSESILHFVRQSKANGDGSAYEKLFRQLRQRLFKATPVREKQISGSQVTADPYQEEVRSRVVDKFMELLCKDRNEYCERLDYFEINFNDAMAALRQTARRDTSEREKREYAEPLLLYESQQFDDDGFDDVLQNLNEPSKTDPGHYRFEVLSAINELPDDERRVIELLIQGYLLREVADIVGCTEKTARHRRNRGRAALAEVLGREDLL